VLMAVNVCLVAMQFQWGCRMYGVSGSDRCTTVKEGSDQVRPCTTGGALGEEVPEGDEHIAARVYVSQRCVPPWSRGTLLLCKRTWPDQCERSK
jgi:hypothetical protein